MSIEAVVPSNHHILCHPLLLLPSVFPNIRVFSNESVLHIRQPNYLSFSISPSNEYSGLISFRIDKIDILTVQGTLKSLTNTTVQKYQFSAHSFLYSPSLTSWSVRSMNQGKLEVVKQEMTRVNIDILGISKLRWTAMGEFNSNDHYIYYCGQESLRRNGVAIRVNKRV